MARATYLIIAIVTVIMLIPVAAALAHLSQRDVPDVVPGSSCIPHSLDFAHPIAGISSQRPICDAIPNLRGCAMPCPSKMMQSGL